jgi:hypothetical protein
MEVVFAFDGEYLPVPQALALEKLTILPQRFAMTVENSSCI